MVRTGALFLFSIAFARTAHADGCFVWRNEKADIREPLQKALIVFRDGREDLVLSVRFEGASEEFGWLVPLPAPPEMAPEDPALFEGLSRETQKPEVGIAAYRAAGEATWGMDAVAVLDERTVGMYQMAVLRAGGAASLEVWLRENGFRAPPGGDRILEKYIEKGWVFAAMKIAPGAVGKEAEAALRSGTVQPIRFRFPAAEAVYPLEVSALNPGTTEVLLYVVAPEPLIPRAGGETWKIEVFSSKRIESAAAWYAAKKPDSILFPEDLSSLALTKCRAVFSRENPDGMHDVLFRPYDPREGLASPREEERLQALTVLGWWRPPGAERLILDCLAGKPGIREVHTALWALGGIGGKDAVAALLDRARPESATRLDAFSALARLKAREALPLFVEDLSGEAEEGPLTPDDIARLRVDGTLLQRIIDYDLDDRIHRLSFAALVAFGDGSSIERLREIANRRGGYDDWEKGEDLQSFLIHDRPGRLAVAALATCGDEDAVSRIVDAVVRGAEAATDERLARSAGNGYTSFDDFWLGSAVMRGVGFYGRDLGDWPALGGVLSLFESKPALRNAIIRRAARTPGLTDAARIILVANLEPPEEDELRSLGEIWERSIRPPVRTIDVPKGGWGWEPDAKVRYNFRAVAVAYAWGRYQRKEELLRAWTTAPQDDPVLRGELAFVMARTKDPAFRNQVLAYAREAWSARVGSGAFKDAVARELVEWNKSQFWGLDEDGRLQTFTIPPLDIGDLTIDIEWYLMRTTTTDGTVGELFERSGDPPFLRLVWIWNLVDRIAGDEAWAKRCSAAVEEIAKQIGEEKSIVRDFIPIVKRSIERAREKRPS